jgi:hypothetical protein
MANKMFYTKEIKGTSLEMCYVTGWVEQGKCSLFIRTKDSQSTYHDFGIITHQDASVIWNDIEDKQTMLKYVEISKI